MSLAYVFWHRPAAGVDPVDGWSALGALNDRAVTGPRRAPHDAAAPGAAVWQRQMVLGPAPEFAVLAPGEVTLPWPSRRTGPQAI